MTNIDISKASKLELLVADVQGQLKYTVLPTRKLKKSELIMQPHEWPSD
jgi:hypothetical protein